MPERLRRLARFDTTWAELFSALFLLWVGFTGYHTSWINGEPPTSPQSIISLIFCFMGSLAVSSRVIGSTLLRMSSLISSGVLVAWIAAIEFVIGGPRLPFIGAGAVSLILLWSGVLMARSVR